jgi:hypothetical protein
MEERELAVSLGSSAGIHVTRGELGEFDGTPKLLVSSWIRSSDPDLHITIQAWAIKGSNSKKKKKFEEALV